ncbi:hypothetical protein [Streptomyces narbonensis]|uniref:hypothetical protein n=1 Tax=Streptomyces narbonensis TaxID=67333 RepID=UPI0033D10038
MPYANEVECANSVFTCSQESCDGVMEAIATGWLNLDRGLNGEPVLSIHGFSESDYEVKCSECGANADDELERAVGAIIYGSGGKDWFRG